MKLKNFNCSSKSSKKYLDSNENMCYTNPRPSAGGKTKASSVQYQSSWSKTKMDLEAKTGRSKKKTHSSTSNIGSHQAISHRYSALPAPNQSVTTSSSDEEEVHIPRKSQHPMRMSLQQDANSSKRTTEIITSNVSLQEALTRKSKKKESVFGNAMRKTKIFLQEAVTGEPVFTDSDWDEDIVREQEIEKMKKKANKKFRQSIIRKSQADPELMKDANALITAYEDAPLRLTTEDQMKLEQKVDDRLQLLREEREVEEEEEKAEKDFRNSQKKPNRLTVAFKALTGGADAIIREEEKRHDFEEQAVKRLTRFSSGQNHQSAPEYLPFEKNMKNDDVSEESSSQVEIIDENSHKNRKNYDGSVKTNHENSNTTQNAHYNLEQDDSNVRFSEKYNDEKIHKKFRKSICPSNRNNYGEDFGLGHLDLKSDSSDDSSESDITPTQNTTTCASNRSKSSQNKIKSQRSERSVENTINSNELSHLRLDDCNKNRDRCVNIETQTSCMVLVTKDQVLESLRKNNCTPIPPKCVSAATQTIEFVNTSNQQILHHLRDQIENGRFESPKQFYSSGKYREKKYNKRRYKNKRKNEDFSDETLDNLASFQRDIDSASTVTSLDDGLVSSFHDNLGESSDFPEISEIDIDIVGQLELEARISLTDPVKFLVDEYTNQRSKMQPSETNLPESVNILQQALRRDSQNTISMVQETILSYKSSESEIQLNQKSKNVSISLPTNYDRFVSNTGIQGYESPKNVEYRSDPFSTYGDITKMQPNIQVDNRMSIESTKGSMGVNMSLLNTTIAEADEQGRVSDFTERSDMNESVGMNPI